MTELRSISELRSMSPAAMRAGVADGSIRAAELESLLEAEVKGYGGDLPIKVAIRRDAALDAPSALACEVIDPWYKEHFERVHYEVLDELLAPWFLGETARFQGANYDPKQYTGVVLLGTRGMVKSVMARMMAQWVFLYRKLRLKEDARIMFCHQVLEKAIEHSSAIKTCALDNPTWRETFPEFKGPQGEWDTKGKWRWPNFTAHSATEQSLTCYGETSSKEGGHYTDRVVDDWVTEDSVTTDTQLELSFDRFRKMDNLRDRMRKYNPWVCMGTHYHFQDTWKRLEGLGDWMILRIPAHTGSAKRIFDLAAIDTRGKEGRGAFDAALKRLKADPPGVLNFPKLIPWEECVRSARTQGPAGYNCFPAGRMVTMGDWTQRPIESILPGDVVIGWTIGERKSRIVRTRVLAAQSRESTVIDVDLASGRKVACTPDHKWYTGRSGTDSHAIYSPLMGDAGNGKTLKALISAYEPIGPCPDERVAGYLGGIFDGEGSVSGRCITIAQCERTNPGVVQMIRHSLGVLGFDWHEHRPKSRPHFCQFQLRGGLGGKLKFLLWCQPAKGEKIAKSLLLCKRFGVVGRDRVQKIELQDGIERVYNIQTGTGNYIVDGYATKNCQMQLNPLPEEDQRFERDALDAAWEQGYPDAESMHLYIRVDPAISEKKKADECAIILGGVDWRGWRWLLDGWVGREKRTTEIVRKSFDLARRWQARGYTVKNIGVESVAFQEALASIMRSGVPSREAKAEGEAIPILTKPCAIRSITRSPDMRKQERIMEMDGPITRRELKCWTENPIGIKTMQQFQNFPFDRFDILDAVHDLWVEAYAPARAAGAQALGMPLEFRKALERRKRKAEHRGVAGTHNTAVLASWG